MAREPSWSLTIEGRPDSTSTVAHNQALSEQRAKSVQDYFISKGVSAANTSKPIGKVY